MTHVLVVDDKEENLYYMRSLLGAHGWRVESAHNGVEALAKAREAPPDLVVSDLLMPAMDGFTLLRHWKADARLSEAPFIVYTATYTEPEDEQLARNLGADEFILKPTEPAELFSRIDAVRSLGASGVPSVAPKAGIREEELLREYNEALIRKLEAKCLQLEDSNRALQRDIVARERAESALRESEANLRLVIEAIPQLVWICLPDGKSTFCNQQWVDATGLARAASQGDGWLDALHPDDRLPVEAAWKRAIAAGERLEREARLRTPSGGHRWWLVRSVPFRDAGGQVSKWFGTATDIEDMKQSAARLRHAEEQLRHAQKMEAIGQLAAGVAHDFNNLLSVILSYSSFVIAELGEGAALGADVEQIRGAAERAAGLTRQLLTFSRKQVLNLRWLDLRELVDRLDPMLRRLLRDDMVLSIQADETIGGVVVDPGSVEQILLNLVVNARDAMPNGGAVAIELADAALDAAYASEHPTVTPGAYVMLAVRDTGHGMDAATRARIFEPFFTTKPLGKGTGLGLATVYGVVTQSGGHIEVESEPGAGTTFRIYLPRSADATAARKGAAGESSAPIRSGASGIERRATPVRDGAALDDEARDEHRRIKKL